MTSIPLATNSDLQLLWLLTSQFTQASPAMTGLKTSIKALQQAILAQEWPALIIQHNQPYLLIFGRLVKILEA